jgi:hypothetical protein
MTLFLHPRGVSAAKWQATRIEAFGFLAARDAIVVGSWQNFTLAVIIHRSPTWT